MRTTTAATRRVSPEVRRAIQESSESVAALSARFGINPKTVRRWRARPTIDSHKTGPKIARSTVLARTDEALIVTLRAMLLLPLDDCLYVLRPFLPDLSRASLHRCLRRHGLSRLPQTRRSETAGSFDLYSIDMGDAALGLRLFVAVERASKFVFADLREGEADLALAGFVRKLAQAAPGRVRVLFTDPIGALATGSGFAAACLAEGVEHRRGEVIWRREQLERIGYAVQLAAHATAGDHDAEDLRRTLRHLVDRYNGASRLKVLGGLSPQVHFQREGPAAAALSSASARQLRARAEPRPNAGRRDPHGTRDAILQAARGLLSRVGPEGLSLSEVARAAGVNRGTAYQHFKSRSELVAATAAWSSQQLTQAVFGDFLPSTERADGRANVAEVARRLADFAVRNPEMSEAWVFQVLSSKDPSQDPFWREFVSRGEKFHQTPMAARGVDGEVMALTILAGAFLWPMWSRSRREAHEDVQGYADRFYREILRISMYGILDPAHFPEIAAELEGYAASA